MRRKALGMAVVLALLLTARPLAAHGLGAECKVRGDRVEVAAYFDDDTAAADARLVVRDEAQAIIAKGRTDDKGLWSFPRPNAGLYRVHVDAGAGHRTIIRITVPTRTEGASPTASSPANSECECCTTDGKAAAPVDAIISDGPSRAEYTRFPWAKVALGLSAIALMGLTWRAYRRWGPRRRLGDGARQVPS